MSRNTILLQVIARLHPEIWDAINPMGPIRGGELIGRTGLRRVGGEPLSTSELSTGSSVADELNPQPMPPSRQVLRATAQLTGQLAQLALTTHAQNGGGAELLVREIDDWCGNRPRPIPWPRNWPWPWPWPPPPDPDAQPWFIAEVFATAALTLAGIGSRLAGRADDGLLAAFDNGADQLSDAAVSAELTGAAS
jgi:hypothetical protein